MSRIIEIAYTKLSASTTEASLRDFVSWLDKENAKDNNVEGLPQQIITRSIIAIGYYLIENLESATNRFQSISQTIEAAAEYALYPNEKNWNAYFFHATNSYPYGAGDGCFSIKELVKEGTHPCAIGTGCTSGAGSLLSNGIESKIAFQIIATNLIPWLKKEDDPVLKNYS